MEITGPKEEKLVTEKPVKVKLKDGTEYQITLIHPKNTDVFKRFWDAYLELCIKQFEKEMLEEMNSSKANLRGTK